MKTLLLITIDLNSVVMLTVGTFLTIVAGIINRQIKRYFERIESAGKSREKKQDYHYKVIEAILYALARTHDERTGQIFHRAYNEKLSELIEKEKATEAEG